MKYPPLSLLELSGNALVAGIDDLLDAIQA